MNAITDFPRDPNGRSAHGPWREMWTYRFLEVNDTEGVTIVLGVDIKEIIVHYEGTNVVARRIGTVVGSAEVCVTSDGFTEIFPVVAGSGVALFTVKAPSDGTINVSITAGR